MDLDICLLLFHIVNDLIAISSIDYLMVIFFIVEIIAICSIDDLLLIAFCTTEALVAIGFIDEL